MGKKISVTVVILYMLLAQIGGHYLKVHWIHVFNSFILVCILHNLLEWKFDCMIDQGEEDNANETINNE